MSEMHKKSSFEDHMATISAGQTKTASVAKTSGADLLSKLAAELGLTKKAEGEGEAGAAMQIAGAKTQADATPAGANPATVAATEALATPQVVLAGGNAAEAAAGEVPKAQGAAADPIVSSGTGDVNTANTLNRTDEAIAAASRGAGGAQAGTLESAAVAQNPPQGSEKNAAENTAEAVKIGQIIAKSFQDSMAKQAEDVEYAHALDILNANSLLEGYNIKDVPVMEKQASVDGLEKIANKQPLSRTDIIAAATQVLELEKQAEEADAQGRAEAHAFVELLTKIAEGEEKEETEEEKKAREAKAAAEAKKEGETVADEKKENEKMAALKSDPAVMGAVRILKSKGLI